MSTSFTPTEIFLHPGDVCFGDGGLRFRTLLGSCVSLTFWHPLRAVGGMCHYMLPHRGMTRGGALAELDGRYADEALALLFTRMDTVGAPRHEYHVKLIGGGNMFPGLGTAERQVGVKNVEAARRLVAEHGLRCTAEHLGGHGYRSVVFDVRSGQVWVRQVTVPVGGQWVDRDQEAVCSPSA